MQLIANNSAENSAVLMSDLRFMMPVNVNIFLYYTTIFESIFCISEYCIVFCYSNDPPISKQIVKAFSYQTHSMPRQNVYSCYRMLRMPTTFPFSLSIRLSCQIHTLLALRSAYTVSKRIENRWRWPSIFALCFRHTHKNVGGCERETTMHARSHTRLPHTTNSLNTAALLHCTSQKHWRSLGRAARVVFHVNSKCHGERCQCRSACKQRNRMHLSPPLLAYHPLL